MKTSNVKTHTSVAKKGTSPLSKSYHLKADTKVALKNGQRLSMFKAMAHIPKKK